MAYKDGEEFTTYCDKEYDRHQYVIKFKDGRSAIFENYEMTKYHWYQWRKEVSTIEVIDPKPEKEAPKGF